jgi:hypothetical protein
MDDMILILIRNKTVKLRQDFFALVLQITRRDSMVSPYLQIIWSDKNDYRH